MCKPPKSESKYEGKPIRFYDKKSHYELIFMDDFKSVQDPEKTWSGSNPLLADLVQDMKDADHSKEIHVFIGSYGGEVVALNTVLQMILQFSHRVGISTGWSCSCGWMLLFACEERYVAPFSYNLFHSMSSFSWGKVKENKNKVEFEEKWWNNLLKYVDSSFLSEEEKKLAETSEVCLTGEELIQRGACKPYSEYCKRTLPKEVEGIFEVGEDLYVKEKCSDKYIRLCKAKKEKKITWQELVNLASK